MFFNDDEISERVNSPENLINRIGQDIPVSDDESEKPEDETTLVVHEIKRGNYKGTSHKPEEIKKLAAALAASGESQQSIASFLGLPQSMVSEISRGNSSIGNPSQSLKDVINRVKVQKKDAESQAISLLISSMSALSPKIGDVKKATDISRIAKDLSSIARDMSGNGEEGHSNTLHVHLHAPKPNTIDDYEIVEAEVAS